MSHHKLTRTLVAIIAAAGLTTSTSSSATAAPDADRPNASTGAAAYGAGWLARQLAVNGGYLAPFGTPRRRDTAYAVLGLHAAGVGRAQAKQAIAFLKTQLGAPLQYADGTDNPGALGYVIMAAVASGADPSHFGGSAAINDLPARLLATERTSGTDTGLFGTADPTYDGAFRQGVALAGLKAARVPVTSVKAPLAWLQEQQCANGLWEAYRADLSAACPAADPDTFTGPDTNSTGMAVQGLAAYGRRPRRVAVIDSLDAVRTSDGGFPYVAAPAQTSDPDSTALSIQALLAEGADPGAAYAALSSFQLGCSDPAADRGAYFFPGDRSPNVFATVQAVPAAAATTLPLPASTLSKALPTRKC